jgi:hypothetical protein
MSIPPLLPILYARFAEKARQKERKVFKTKKRESSVMLFSRHLFTEWES